MKPLPRPSCYLRQALYGSFALLFFAGFCAAEGQEHAITFTAIAKDPGGFPILGAIGRLASLDRVLQVKSGADGVLRFFHVAAGTHNLQVSAPGFNKQTLRGIEITSSNTQPIEVTLPIGGSSCGRSNLLDYDNSRSPRIPLAGRVLNADSGKPVSGAKVEIFGTGDKREVASVRSNKEGEFSFDGLLSGQYSARVRKDGYWPSKVKSFFVARESSTIFTLYVDRNNHIHVCE